VLDLLSKAEQAFKRRLVVGFATLVPVLNYVADIPFHPVQNQILKLILNCISDFPGMVSSSHITELVPVLAKILKKHSDGEIGMLEETFILTCSVLVAIVRTPSVHGNLNLQISIKEAMQHVVLACLSISEKNPCQLLHSLFLLKEAYNHEGNSADSTEVELRQFIVNVCTKHWLPWFGTNFSEMDEETVLGILETFHLILLQDSNNQAAELAENLVSSNCSLVDVLMGNDSGQPIRDATLCLPSDPIDLIFLLGQKNSRNLELSSCQSAILLILYTSSLYDERLADDKLVLASLEQYILINSSDLQGGSTDPSTVMRLVYLYGLGFRERTVIWMIVEELAMSLAVPCLASKNFINLHKPAIHVAVTLLKLPKVLEWMRSVFDDSCISGIIQNLAENNLSTEIVLLFQALLKSEYLKAEQISMPCTFLFC
ncbi:unnamed protein product, partial [Prunus brigantina]